MNAEEKIKKLEEIIQSGLFLNIEAFVKHLEEEVKIHFGKNAKVDITHAVGAESSPVVQITEQDGTTITAEVIKTQP